MRNSLLCVLVILCVVSVGHAGNSFNESGPIQEVSRYLGATLGAFVYADCIPAVPSASLTLDALACTAFVADDLLPPHYIPVLQQAIPIGPLNGGDGTYWLGVCQDSYTAIPSWTRQSSSHYVWKLNGSEPSTPMGCLITAKVTVAGGVVSAVLDLGKTIARPPVSRAFTALGVAPEGTTVFCPNCTTASSPCSGGGTGALAVRQGAAWKCL